MVKVREDMTGWKMWEHGVPDSRLTVIKQVEDYIEPNGTHRAQYLCSCNCGSNKNVIGIAKDIKYGKVKSCGCLRIEYLKITWINNKKYNKYELNLEDENGLYGIGYCSNTGNKFYFDMEDYDKIKDYCWSESIDHYNYHSVQSHEPETNNVVKLNWLIVGKNYDHIDRNPLNNRRNNLRSATSQENTRNRNIRKDNTSGIIGVYWDKRYSKWYAIIREDEKNIHLGRFINKEDAIKARLQAEAKYYGEFAPQQHLFEQYSITIQNELEDINELQVI